MSIKAALHHHTSYQYDRKVTVGPQIIRLRPAPHTRTPIDSYSLKVSPENHFINWQQDPHGNFLARIIFEDKIDHLTIDVDLIADMAVINPFDFFVEEAAESYPFEYKPEEREELKPYLVKEEVGPYLKEFIETIDHDHERTIDFLVGLNQKIQKHIDYTVRLEPGVQSCEKTLELLSGSCRDSAWLLVQSLRQLGMAARFTSGYLIQLKPDVKSLDGPSGTEVDFTDLHAWAEVFLPGAGWVGMDPTSGLFTGEGHIPLASTPSFSGAAPISGGVEECETEFEFEMTVSRFHEDPRVTKPYSDEQWAAIDKLGHEVDQKLKDLDVRLTMGGEPTFVSIDSPNDPQWQTEALGEEKNRLANELMRRMKRRFGTDPLMHYGQGKWYPGEPIPRWGKTCFARVDGKPLWARQDKLADESKDYGHTAQDAMEFGKQVAVRLDVGTKYVSPVFEDVLYHLWEEQRLPADVDLSQTDFKDDIDRKRLARVLEQGLDKPVGCILPLQFQRWLPAPKWVSSFWRTRTDRVYLIPGDSPMGYRLPLNSLVKLPSEEENERYRPLDPTVGRSQLPAPAELRIKRQMPGFQQSGKRLEGGFEELYAESLVEESFEVANEAAKNEVLSAVDVAGATAGPSPNATGASAAQGSAAYPTEVAPADLSEVDYKGIAENRGEAVPPGVGDGASAGNGDARAENGAEANGAVANGAANVGMNGAAATNGVAGVAGTSAASEASNAIPFALCIEPRGGTLHVFMPPTDRLEQYLEIIAAVEDTAVDLDLPVIIEGYKPPSDHRLKSFSITPDPGVIEVNIQPAGSWDELKEITEGLYEDAYQSRLGTEKFELDGAHSGTGGGNHLVLGGPTPLDSPLLRRPDLLRSLIGFWQNHPSLSYMFSGRFIGPTSQAPRVDEGRSDSLYELQIAFDELNNHPDIKPWMADRLFRNLLIDVTGNTHRAEFCIDKMYSPDSSTGRLGLLEFRGFEMPPHERMSLTQQLLIRTLVARFWEKPYVQPLVDWKTRLHDQFMLPYFVWRDFLDVVESCQADGYHLDAEWFRSHFEFRFPFIGKFTHNTMKVELRQAIEPWNVLGEESTATGTSRYVDSSVERMQVLVTGYVDERYVFTCNGRTLPLHPTEVQGQYVAGVRFRAWQPPSCLHPTIPVDEPLTFDLYDSWMNRSVDGCRYHVGHPGGLNPSSLPVNSYEAESRRAARFSRVGHGGVSITPRVEPVNRDFPMTLDLRKDRH